MMSQLEFDCKLAHCDEIKRLSNFKSIKELYELVAKSFQVPIDQILYCTLNTHNFRDMKAVLGNYLSLGDCIVVHMYGQCKEIELTKTQEFLGLTIADNGQGRAFVKKVKSDQEFVEANIGPGDHIAAINAQSIIGLRHFEVAKTIREIPKGVSFTMTLVQPKYLVENLQVDSFKVDEKVSHLYSPSCWVPPESRGNDSKDDVGGGAMHPSYDIQCDDLIHSSLPIEKLLSRRTFEASLNGYKNHDDRTKLKLDDYHSHGHDPSDTYKTTIDKINNTLESFLGIHDSLLAIQLYRLARENKDSYTKFLDAFRQSELSEFDFDDGIKNHLWTCATNS